MKFQRRPSRLLSLTAVIALLAAAMAPVGSSAAQTARAPRAAAPAALAPADKALVDRASAYLQAMPAAQGRFTQTDPRGQVQRGAFYIQRPGKIRFEYDAPSKLLVVSDGANVKMWDPRLRTFDQYPLSQTPLSVFLAKSVRLDQGVRIDRVARTAEGFQITARDSRRPNDGSIALDFANGPRLTGWTIADAQGQRTRVRLDTLSPASGLAANLFVLRDPTARARR